MTFDPSEFTPTKWATTQDKATFAKQFVRFVESDFAAKHFTDKFYRRLSNTFGHIAHYNRGGFWDTFIRTFLGDQVVKGELKSQYPSLIGSGSVGPNPSGSTPDPSGNFSSEVAGYLKDRHIPMESAQRIQRLFDSGEPLTLANVKGHANA